MTIEIKCANCPTTVQRIFGPDDDATAPWLCSECDKDEDEVPVEDEGLGSEQEQNPELTLVDQGNWFEDDSVAGRPTRAQRKKAEQRLAKYGLARHQLRSQQDIQAVVKPIIEGSELQGGIQAHQFDRELSRKSWHGDARCRANGSELNGYHAVQTREHKRLIPVWTLSDDRVREVLHKLFPKHDKDARQRESAGRWLRIIYLYFRVNQWAKTIAEATGISVRAVENVIYRARKVGAEMFGSVSSAIDTYGDVVGRACELKAA
jgi:hypothetical protein